MRERGARSVEPRSGDPSSVDPSSVDPSSVDPSSVDPHTVLGFASHLNPPSASSEQSASNIQASSLDPQESSSESCASLNESSSSSGGMSEVKTLLLQAQRIPDPDPSIVCAPFYDTARLFITIRDLRPHDQIVGSCYLESMSLECQNLSKRQALSAVHTYLQRHSKHYLPDLERATEIGAVGLYHAQGELISTLEEVIPLIGVVDEERFVVGNDNRPKMTPQEADAMLRIKSTIERLIKYTKHYKGNAPQYVDQNKGVRS